MVATWKFVLIREPKPINPRQGRKIQERLSGMLQKVNGNVKESALSEKAVDR